MTPQQIPADERKGTHHASAETRNSRLHTDLALATDAVSGVAVPSFGPPTPDVDALHKAWVMTVQQNQANVAATQRV